MASESVVRAIRDEIRAGGSMRFDRFMELALYAPGGYFERPPVGADPAMDFVTSPHVHPVFAVLLATAIRDVHAAMGAPPQVDLIEIGAGDGTLLRGLLAELDGLASRVVAVERSAGARAALSELEGVEVVDRLPTAERATIVLAHELLDDVPFRRLVGTPGGPREVVVALDGDALVERHAPVDDPPRRAPADGQELVLQHEAARLVVEALAGPAPRAFLAIDYGTETGAGGPAHGYAGHRVVEDLLATPGEIDITSGVDFGALAGAVTAAGSRCFPTVSQHDALLALGLEDWLGAELERQGELLRSGRGADAVGAWSGRSRATLLADPAGLGRFRWFFAATPDVGEPAWLRNAIALSR